MADPLLQADASKDNLIEQVQDLQERMDELERFALTSQNILARKIGVGNANLDDISDGDIANIPLTDYSATSTIVGWSSFTTKTILYKKVGKTVLVQFAFQGVSDVTTASFTLLDSVDVLGSGQVIQVLVYGIDNGTPQTLPARLDIPASGNVFNMYKTLAAAAWTGSGTKGVRGEFFYFTA